MIAGLPYDAEVEYLESTGTQYIDTGVKFSGADDINISFSATDSSYYAAIFGAGNADGDAGASYSVYLQNRAQVVFQCTAARGAAFNYSSGVRYNVSCAVSNGAMSVDGSPCGTNGTPLVSCDYNVYLFARNVAGSVDRRGKFRVYSFSIAGKVDFIPVRFTNELGQSEGAMYDRVSRKLFRNAGTGAFAIGPDVATPVMGLHFFKSQIKTAKDYVQDGLIAMWDGIENVGYGQHDDAATTWTDLTGRGSGWLLKDSHTTQVFEVGSDYVKILAGINYNGRGHCTPSWSSEDDVKQMEIVLDNTDFSETASSRICSFGVGNGTYTSQMAIRDGNLFQFGYKKYPLLQLGTGLSAISFDKDTARGLFNGVLTDSLKSTVGSGYVYFSPCISAYASQPATGIKIKSLRIYNRVLTEAEMLANYAVDKLRFNLTPSS